MIVSPRGHRLLRMAMAIGALAVALLAIVDHVQLAHMAQTSPRYAARDQVQALAQRMDTLDATLTRLQHTPAIVTQTAFDAARHVVDARLAELEQRADAAARSDALKALEARVLQLETHLASGPSVASRATPPTPHRPSKPVALVPPFVILGEEQRGGETFLSIAPPHLHALGEAHLLQPGDNEGDWQLEALEGHTAIFRVDDQILRLPVR